MKKPIRQYQRSTIKLSHMDRLRVIVLLRQGKSRNEIIRAMHQRHSGRSIQEVQRAYFPRTSSYSLGRLENLPRNEVTRIFNEHIRKTWIAQQARGKAHLAKLTRTPEFLAQHQQRSGARFTELWRDPAFREKRRRGVQRYWEKHRTGFTSGKQKPLLRLLRKKLSDPNYQKNMAAALIQVLPQEERQVMQMLLGVGTVQKHMPIPAVAARLSLRENIVRQYLKKALRRLYLNAQSRHLFDGMV